MIAVQVKVFDLVAVAVNKIKSSPDNVGLARPEKINVIGDKFRRDKDLESVLSLTCHLRLRCLTKTTKKQPRLSSPLTAYFQI